MDRTRRWASGDAGQRQLVGLVTPDRPGTSADKGMATNMTGDRAVASVSTAMQNCYKDHPTPCPGDAMIAIIFEVTPHDGKQEEYLSIAASMRSLVEQVDGFVSVERFQSLTTPGKLLSISFFESEAAVAEWRQLAEHRSAQDAGRKRIFSDYRIRVLSVMRDYGMQDRLEAPTDSLDAHG